MWRSWNFLAFAGGTVNGAVTVELVQQFIKKLNKELPFDAAIPLLGLCPNELKAGISVDICKPMFIPALFIAAKRWKKNKSS